MQTTQLVLGSIFLAAALSMHSFGASLPLIKPTKRKGKVIIKTQYVTFARHENVSISTGTVQQWLDAGNKALQRKDYPNDVRCRVRLKRQGDVVPFTDYGSDIFLDIGTEAEFNVLGKEVNQLVKLTNSISWCEGPSSGIILGCAAPGNIVIAAPSIDDPLVLVHEFGHHKGLDGQETDPEGLMYDGSPSGSKISQGECNAFLVGAN